MPTLSKAERIDQAVETAKSVFQTLREYPVHNSKDMCDVLEFKPLGNPGAHWSNLIGKYALYLKGDEHGNYRKYKGFQWTFLGRLGINDYRIAVQPKNLDIAQIILQLMGFTAILHSRNCNTVVLDVIIPNHTNHILSAFYKKLHSEFTEVEAEVSSLRNSLLVQERKLTKMKSILEDNALLERALLEKILS